MFSLAIIHAIKRGRLEVLIWFLQEYRLDFMLVDDDEGIWFEYAVEFGHLHICKWLLSLPEEFGIHPAENDNDLLILAFYKNHWKIFRWLLSLPEEYNIYFPVSQRDVILSELLEDGHLNICKLLLKLPERYKLNPGGINNKAFRKAVQIGHFDICELIYKHYSMIDYSDVLIDIVEDNYELRKRLLGKIKPLSPDIAHKKIYKHIKESRDWALLEWLNSLR